MWNTCKEYDDINSTTAALGGLKTATVYGVKLNIICIDSAMLIANITSKAVTYELYELFLVSQATRFSGSSIHVLVIGWLQCMAISCN